MRDFYPELHYIKSPKKKLFLNIQNRLDLALLLLFEMSSYIIRMGSMADGLTLPCGSKSAMISHNGLHCITPLQKAIL